ncbi:MAG: hypothetical protein Q8880_05600 [Bacteroidota bacterium]|nr:hypothetical protein [Bacteroidota bacterium]
MIKNKLQILIFSLIILSSLITHAQITRISSPYSRFGLGEMQNTNYSGNFGMAGIGYGFRNSANVNYFNPASYTALDSSSFVYEANIFGTLTQTRTWDLSQKSSYASLGSLTFAFPVTGWWYSSFGLLPYSSVGYKISDIKYPSEIGQVTYKYEGDGGLNQIYIGNAFKLNKHLSFGFNADYIFGYINETESENYTDLSFISLQKVKSLRFNHLNFNLGLQYYTDLKNDLKLTTGASFTIPQRINAMQDLVITTFKENETNYYAKDTIENSTDNKISVKMPLYFGAGFTLQKKDKWMIGVDYTFQNWSDFSIDRVSDNLKDSHIISAGGEIIPSKISNNYLKKIAYRAGLSYNFSDLLLKDKRINEYGFYLGFGFPMRRSKSMINVAFELGRRGTTANGLIKENFAKANIAFTLHDRWFIKRKYE